MVLKLMIAKLDTFVTLEQMFQIQDQCYAHLVTIALREQLPLLHALIIKLGRLLELLRRAIVLIAV